MDMTHDKILLLSVILIPYSVNFELALGLLTVASFLNILTTPQLSELKVLIYNKI